MSALLCFSTIPERSTFVAWGRRGWWLIMDGNAGIVGEICRTVKIVSRFSSRKANVAPPPGCVTLSHPAPAQLLVNSVWAGGGARRRAGGGARTRGHACWGGVARKARVLMWTRRSGTGHRIQPEPAGIGVLIHKVQQKCRCTWPRPAPLRPVPVLIGPLAPGRFWSSQWRWRGVVRVADVSGGYISRRLWHGSCGARGPSSSRMQLQNRALAQIAVRVWAPTLDLTANQRVEESHHSRVLLHWLADVIMWQATSAVEDQAYVFLMSVERARFVLHQAFQISKTIWLLIRTPYLQTERGRGNKRGTK